MMPLETDLARLQALAQSLPDDYAAFQYYVEDDDLSDVELDALVEALAAPIIAAIDCTQCANCCRSLDVYLTPQDAERLSDGLLIPLEAIQDHYIETDRAALVDEWGMFKARPCSFLDGNLCSVYAHRPESCRAYPVFTPDFRWQLTDILSGTGSCPIIFHVVEAVKKALNW